MVDSTDTLSVLSDVHAVLGATRRCHTIRLLAEFDETPLQASTLANHITAIEENILPSQASGESYRNVYNALTQTHLPRLADIEVIRYDSRRKTLTIGPQFPMARLLLGLNHTAYLILNNDSVQAVRDPPSIGD